MNIFTLLKKENDLIVIMNCKLTKEYRKFTIYLTKACTV